MKLKELAKRSLDRMDIYQDAADATIVEVAKFYEKALKDIEEDMQKIFSSFMNSHGLSYEQANRLLSSKITPSVLNDLRNRIAALPDGQTRRELLSLYNSHAYAARISRLEALRTSLIGHAEIAAEMEGITVENFLEKVGVKAYERGMFDVQRQTGFGFNFSDISETKLKTILGYTWSGVNYRERILRRAKEYASELEEAVKAGMLSGKAPKRVIDELVERTGMEQRAASTLVRTETTYVANQAEMESYKQAGIDSYRFIATLDQVTCPICGQIDREIFPVSWGVPGTNMPPMHPNCRCTTVAVVPEGYEDDMERRAKDGQGNRIKLPADTTYREWAARFKGR